MKTLNYLRLLPIFALALFLTSCEGDGWNNIRGTGPVYSETRDVPTHRDISVAIPADVYIVQSPVRDLTIEAQANVLDAIETYVSGNELKIKLENGAGLGRHETIKIYISSAYYNSIRLSGSVNLYSETPVITEYFDVSLSGSGLVDAIVIAETVRASISGSGEIRLEGTTLMQEFTVSGSGNIFAFNLLSETADISLSGSGDAEVSVSEYLKASISGSANIYYRGFPDIDSRISGSGRVVHVN